MAANILVADIGGTTTRIARCGADGALFDMRVEANDGYVSLEDLLGTYLAGVAGERPRAAMLAVAGPVDGDHVRLTNRNWGFSRHALADLLEFQRVDAVNDFVALAHGVAHLGPEDLTCVSEGHTAPDAPRLVCGPGTGFGTALVLPRPDGAHVLPSEAGHMRFGATTAEEARILAHLAPEHGQVVVEHVLSGGGLVRLHRLFTGTPAAAHVIVMAAIDGQPAARDTCAVFLRVLGRILGDLALAFEARGGVYVGGGVARAMAPLFAASPFRAAFEDHPPYGARLAQVPVHVVTHAAPGLLGAAQLGRRLLRPD